jgi:hypothetical protein
MQHSDILIIGDSFAQRRDSESDWPTLLAALQSGVSKHARGQGFGGASWWSIRKCLLAELDVNVPQVLIICHTEAARIPSDFDFGLNVASATKVQVPVTAEHAHNYVPAIREAAAMYYTYLTSSDYANWAQTAWYSELESILTNYNIPKVVHLHCFPPAHSQNSLHCFKVGVTNSVPLWDLCKDIPQASARNHFTAEQNIKIAHAINNTLVAYPQASGWVNINLIG